MYQLNKCPTNWKRNSIPSALDRAKQISWNFQEEVKSIKKTFLNAGYPYNFVISTIHNFEVPKQHEETLLPSYWFDNRKENINLPFCNANYRQSRKFQLKIIYNHSLGDNANSKSYGRQRNWSLFSRTKTEITIRRMLFTTARAAAS